MPRWATQARLDSAARYVALSEDHVTRKLTTLSWEEVAGLPLAALKAVVGLRLGGYDPMLALSPAWSAPDQASQPSIFINGGSTSVGIYAIQLAKALSLRMTASASGRNAEFVRGIGADVVLDYTARPVAEQLGTDPAEPRFDMVFDAVGSLDTALYVRSGSYVKKGGVYATTGPWLDETGWSCLFRRWARAVLRPSFLGGTATTWKMIHVVNNKEDMSTLCTFIERGALRPCVDSTYEFGSALDRY